MEEFLGWFKQLPGSMIVNYNSASAGGVMGFGRSPNATYREAFDMEQKKYPQGSLLVALTPLDFNHRTGEVSAFPVIILGPAFYDEKKLRKNP
jgi:hypothetical protein